MMFYTKTCALLITIFLIAQLCSCDMFEYHPYASEIYGRRNIHMTSTTAVESMCQGLDTIKFAFITSKNSRLALE